MKMLVAPDGAKYKLFRTKIFENFYLRIEFSFNLCYTRNITRMVKMKIQTGYIYHIKDEFFDKINHKGLMSNHENEHVRPTYFTIKDKDIL